MRYENTKCIIIDAAPSGESDKSLVLCTQNFGKITALAPGALKPAARLSPALEPFRETRVTLWAKPGSFRNRITSAVTEDSFAGIFESSPRTAAAFECAKIYSSLTPYFEPDEAKYNLMRRALGLLCRSENPEPVALGLSLRMLKISGYDFAAQCPRRTPGERRIADIAARFSRISGDALSAEYPDGADTASLRSAVGFYVEEICGTRGSGFRRAI